MYKIDTYNSLETHKKNISFRTRNINLEKYSFSNETLKCENIDELEKYEFFNSIIWLKIDYIVFDKIFIFPKSLENIFLYRCENLNDNLTQLPNTIKNVEIKECKLVNYNLLFNKNQIDLESCNLSYNRIDTIYDVFPDNLVSLDLSTNDIKKFPDINFFSNNLVALNLSNNKFNDLPKSILTLNENCNISLMPNSFWFNSYTNISLNKTIHDYHLDIATRFFSDHLRLKLYNIKNNIVQQQQFGIFINNNPTLNTPANIIHKKVTAEDPQNIHNSDIQNSFNKSVKAILDYEAPKIIDIITDINNYYKIIKPTKIYSWFGYIYIWITFNTNQIQDIYNKYDESNQVLNEIKKRFDIEDIISSSGITYKELFLKIWCITEIHQHKHEIRKIIKQEILASVNKCFTGCTTRLVNSLSGFIDGVQIGYSENEQISNIVVMIMRKCDKDNSLNPYTEVKKALDELNISEDKQKPWLEAL
jgi:hypothetical protein